MAQAITPIIVLLLALAPSTSWAQGTIFTPSQCRSLCKGSFVDLKDATDNFLSIDPNGTSSFVRSRASSWGVSLLRLVKEAVKTPASAQNVTITPPAVARLLGGYSLAVYQAFAVWSEYLYPYGRYFQPLSSDMVNLRDQWKATQWDILTEPYGEPGDVFRGPDLSNFAPPEEQAVGAQQAAISGAASKFISLFFCNSRALLPFWCDKADLVLNSTMNYVGKTDRYNFPVPFRQGEDIATLVFDQLSMVNLLQDNQAALQKDHQKIHDIPATPQNRSQPTAVVHDCSRVNALGGPWYWQRLTVPRVNTFRPSTNASTSPFPPADYPTLSPGNVITPFFRGFAAAKAGAALRSTEEARPMLLQGVAGPPMSSDEAGFRRAMREVLQQSATLDDKKKVIAEFWADGPESTTPPGHWFKIAIEESNSNSNDAFILKDLNVLDRTVWATLLVGLSLHEAGLMAWELKLEHMGSRPITGIQCLVGRNTVTNTSMLGTAWRGPYMGVGRRDLGTWQPFQSVTFVTPPFSGYVSGHATFSAAAAEALRQTRSGFNTTFQNPSYNCYRTPAGFSSVEPKIAASQSGGVAGVTDRPNRGPKTIGYSPARNIVMCWRNYEEAAEQAAVSRLYGGIHIAIDNDDGLNIGKRLGESVAASLAMLSPAYTMPKETVESRPTPLPDFGNFDTQVIDFVCPPGTFVRMWDGRHDTNGLYALGVTCSDGTFIGTLGTWGPGLDFVQSTVADGYVAITVIIDSIGAVVGVSFQDRADEDSTIYGMPQGERVTTTCNEDQRIVGLTTRSTGGAGNIGTFGLLCGKVTTEDVTFRTDPVPDNPDAGLWRYDYQCPEGTFITRFFGRAGAYVNTFTAQCASRWNLRNVGIPYFAQPGDTAFSHTSADGYSGMDVKSYTGGVDCLRFVTAAGVQSRPYGTPSVPGSWAELRCDDNSRVIGVFGWQDAYVSSIGIICSPGDFGPIVASAKTLRMQRNPMHAQRIPCGPIIANTTDQAVTVSVSSLPTSRISTSVTGASKMRRVSTPVVQSRVDAHEHVHAVSSAGLVDEPPSVLGSLVDKAAAPENALYLLEGLPVQKTTILTSSADANATAVDISTHQFVLPLDPQQPV